MKNGRRKFTGEEKIAILRRHLVEKMPVSDVCEQAGINPTLFYRWQKELFENGAAAFGRRSDDGILRGTCRRATFDRNRSERASRAMGWWETRTGDVIGDPPLDQLDEHPAALHWKTPDDIPPEVLSIIVKSYRDDLDREPRRTELEALLSFHQIDAVPVRNPTPGPAGPIG